jgi:hypothetical protein
MTDSAIQVLHSVPQNTTISPKPCHLVCIKNDKSNKGVKTDKMFIALERPVLETSFIQTKGFFVDADEEAIVNGWQDMVKTYTTDKKNVQELYIPWHSISYIRNLVYKADKSK